MTYCVKLAKTYVKDCPQWFINFWHSPAANAPELNESLAQYHARYIHDSDGNNYLEFRKESDYTMFLLKWSNVHNI